MPSRSNSTPVVMGDKVFVCSEPTTLVCVRASDGKILWQRDNTYLDTVSPEERDKVRRKLEEIDIENTTKEFRKTENQLNNAKNKLEKSPDDEELKQKIEDLSKKFEELKIKLAPVDKYVMPKTHDTNGYSSATPVSDGKNIYVLFGTGIAACYDMEGNRKWIKMLEKPKDDWGHSASPLIVGDKLLVHINSLIALDKKTGEQIWKSEAKPRWGTSVHTRIDDSGTTMVLEPGREPKEVATNALESFRSSPVFVGKRVYIRGLEHLYCIGE